MAMMERLSRLEPAAGLSDRPKAVTCAEVRNVTRNMCIGSEIQVANTSALRRKGLLGQTGLAIGSGLWIVPCESVHTFFMRFSLDLIYLDRDWTVLKVVRSVVPWRMSICLRAHSILELPEGTIPLTSTAPGDRLEFAGARRP